MTSTRYRIQLKKLPTKAPQPNGDPATPPEKPISEQPISAPVASIDPLQPISLLPIAGVVEASNASQTKTLNDVTQQASLPPHRYFLQASVAVEFDSINIRTGLFDQFQTVSLIEPESLTSQTFSAGKTSASNSNQSPTGVASSFSPFAFDTAHTTPTSFSDTLETKATTSAERTDAGTPLLRDSSSAEDLKLKIRPVSHSGLELLDAVFALPEGLILSGRTTGLEQNGLATVLPISQPAASKPEGTEEDRSVTPLIESIFVLTVIAGERTSRRKSVRLVGRKTPE